MKIISMPFEREVILLSNVYQQLDKFWKELEVREFKKSQLSR